MDKKGYIFEIVLVIFSFSVLIALIFVVIENNPSTADNKLMEMGTRAQNLLSVYLQADTDQAILDVEAGYDAHKIMQSLAHRAGYKELTSSFVSGPNGARYQILETYPNIRENFLELFSNEYPDHSIYFQDNLLVGTPFKKRTINTLGLSYEYYPSFSFKTTFGNSDYDTIFRIADRYKAFGECLKLKGYTVSCIPCNNRDYTCFDIKPQNQHLLFPLIYRYALPAQKNV